MYLDQAAQGPLGQCGAGRRTRRQRAQVSLLHLVEEGRAHRGGQIPQLQWPGTVGVIMESRHTSVSVSFKDSERELEERLFTAGEEVGMSKYCSSPPQ